MENVYILKKKLCIYIDIINISIYIYSSNLQWYTAGISCTTIYTCAICKADLDLDFLGT